MITNVSEELYIFLATIYGGMLIGLIYDLYRLFRGIFRPKRLATMIEDLVFWIIIGGVAFFVLLLSNDGQLRFYTFLGFGLGAGMYILVLSPFVIRISIKILKFLKKLSLKLWRILIYPIKKLTNLIKGPLNLLLKKLRPLYYKVKKIKKLPRRMANELKKQIRLILRKK